MSNDHLPVKDPAVGQPVPNPGLEPEIPRYTDANPAAGNRAYRAILTMLALVPVLAILFVVIYFAVPKDSYIDFGIMQANAQNVGFGATGGLAALLIGLSLVQWARVIMGDEESVEERHSAASTAEDREVVAAEFEAGVEQSGIRRRKLLGGALGGAVGFGLIPAVILLADLGPHPTKSVRRETIERTIWSASNDAAPGEEIRLVNDETKLPLRPRIWKSATW